MGRDVLPCGSATKQMRELPFSADSAKLSVALIVRRDTLDAERTHIDERTAVSAQSEHGISAETRRRTSADSDTARQKMRRRECPPPISIYAAGRRRAGVPREEDAVALARTIQP